MKTENENRVVEILMSRDGISREEAQRLIDETVEEIQELLDSDECSMDEVEQIIADNLGLEPDYLDGLLF